MRTLSDKMAWTDETRAFELLDWETKPEDFDRLCDRVIGFLRSRGHWTTERLFVLVPEEQLRREIRATAERFEERFISLPMFIYMWLNTSRLPQLSQEQQARGEP
jgi:hypothetical protein